MSWFNWEAFFLGAIGGLANMVMIAVGFYFIFIRKR